MRISVVLPVYRTAHCARELRDRLVATLAPLTPDFEILMVDDGSPDQAWPVLVELAREDSRVKALRLSRNFGQHPALCAGFDHATGDVIVMMDADLQDAPELIPTLLAALTPDKDIVFTIKEDQARPALVERLTSRLYHLVFSRITRSNVPVNIGTYRLFSRTFLDAMQTYHERNILIGPLMFHMGFQSAVVPVRREARQGNGSSYTFLKRLELAVNSLLAYTDIPHRFLIGFGALIIAASLLYMLAAIVKYFVTSTSLPPGLTLLAVLISFSLGTLMLGLGIIGIYVFRVYQEVLQRPRYLIERKLNVPPQERV